MAKNKTIVLQYPKRKHFNIGVIIFLVILVYVCYHLFSWLTAVHIAIYEVEYGTIAENNTYQGLLLRQETIVEADRSGTVNYYLKDRSKASVKTLVCSVDETGSVSDLIAGQSAENRELSDESLSDITGQVSAFATTFDPNLFFRVTRFKEEITSSVMEAMNRESLNEIAESGAFTTDTETFHLIRAPKPGIITYYTDGYESVTSDSVTLPMMDERNYQRNRFRSADQVAAGATLFKIADNEDWEIVLQVDENVRSELSDTGYVTIRFLSDDQETTVPYSFRNVENESLMILSLNHSMVRYAGERFTEIELELTKKEGLKIPNTAIVDKTFLLVPKQYFTQGGNGSDRGLLKKTVNEDGEEELIFIPTDLFFETDESYYIEEDVIRRGDEVADPNNHSFYPVSAAADLQGVYNVNKGYATFRKIDPIFSNEEYTIVKTGTPYGLSLYDHIALNGKEVSENMLL